MFSLIILTMIVIVSYKIYMGQIGLLLSFCGFLAGISIGYVAGRMFKIFWHEETQKVVSRIDRIGAVFLTLYICVEIGRKWLFGYWLHGAKLNAFGLIFLAGLLLGRLLVMAHKIKKILIQENKLGGLK